MLKQNRYIKYLYSPFQATWQLALQCRIVWCRHRHTPLEQPGHNEVRWKIFKLFRIISHSRNVQLPTLMSSSSAVAFLIPAGTHFLWAGSSSSFPKRFHSPSSSKGVSTGRVVPTLFSSSSSPSPSLTSSTFGFSSTSPSTSSVPLMGGSLFPTSARVSPEKEV